MLIVDVSFQVVVPVQRRLQPSHYGPIKGGQGFIEDVNEALPSLHAFGKPRLFVGITSGNLDSMVSNYTASQKKRRTDDLSFSESGEKRPDRAVIVYANLVKRVWKDVPIVLGGIEASLRRFGHYDWWQDKVRHSILLDSKADFI